MPKHRGKYFVRIARIDRQRGNLLPISQSGEMRPCFARVGRLVDSIAHRKIRAMQSFAAGDVDDVWIRRGYRNCADRLRGLMVEDWIPGAPVIVRLPHSAVHLSDIENIRLAGNSGGGARASPAEGANHAPVQFLVSVFGNLRPDADR